MLYPKMIIQNDYGEVEEEIEEEEEEEEEENKISGLGNSIDLNDDINELSGMTGVLLEEVNTSSQKSEGSIL